jgi:methionine synthase II (cobalamin-independent)
MKRSTERILTTHCGSLARPKDLLDLLKAKVNAESYDENALNRRVRSAVAEAVRNQAESGIDIVTDGEQGKPGFFAYVRERLNGFEAKPQKQRAWKQWAAELAAFPSTMKITSAGACWEEASRRARHWCVPGRSAIAGKRRYKRTSRISGLRSTR